MTNSDFEKRISALRSAHEELIGRKNPAADSNGVWTRYTYPILTAAHTPLFWRYDLNPATNPFLLERFGINGTFNAGAIKFDGKYVLVVRVEGNDRKSFFALAESDNGIDGFRFRDHPLTIPPIDESETNLYDMRLTSIGINENKNTYFPLEKREQMIRDYYRNEPRIIVQSYDCLTIDFARQVDASLIIRGIRTVKDFEYEETIADINRKLTGIETILLFTEPELTCVSSTTVRELLQYGKDISMFIPEGMEIRD